VIAEDRLVIEQANGVIAGRNGTSGATRAGQPAAVHVKRPYRPGNPGLPCHGGADPRRSRHHSRRLAARHLSGVVSPLLTGRALTLHPSPIRLAAGSCNGWDGQVVAQLSLIELSGDASAARPPRPRSQWTGIGPETTPSKDPLLAASTQAIITQWPVRSRMTRPL
jgi:hypothetical protein